MVVAQLSRAHPQVHFELSINKTKGDAVRDRALTAIGGQGLFTKELERALLAGEIHLAVHSMKDLPTALSPGLCVAAVPQREDPRDVLVSGVGLPLAQLPSGARVGTGSPRRKAQLIVARPDLDVCGIRGNVDTRLRKLEEGQVNALVLAAAGLARLGRLDVVTEYLDEELMVPAVGQGALAIEAVEGNEATALAAGITHDDTQACVVSERSLLQALGGGCAAPIAAHATTDGPSKLRLTGLVSTPDAGRLVRHTLTGDRSQPERLGEELAQYLLANGGREIMSSLENRPSLENQP